MTTCLPSGARVEEGLTGSRLLLRRHLSQMLLLHAGECSSSMGGFTFSSQDVCGLNERTQKKVQQAQAGHLYCEKGVVHKLHARWFIDRIIDHIGGVYMPGSFY